MKIFEQIKNTSRLSLYSPIFVLMCGVITYISWAIGNSLLGMAILMLIACVVLIINADITPVLPCLIFTIFTASDNNILNEDKTWPTLIVLAILIVGAFISHIISYPIKFKQYKLTYPLIGVSIALFMGGIGYLNSSQYLNGIIFILSLGPCMLLLYYLIMAYSRPPKEINYKKYICYIMMMIGIIVMAQMITHLLRLDISFIESLRNDAIILGWGNRNGIASLYLITAPCCFYLAFNNKKFCWLFYAIGLIFYFGIVVTFSRAGMLAAAIMLPALLIYSFFKGANRSQLLITICTFAIVIAAFILIRMDFVLDLIEHISDLTMTSSGRWKLYDEALICFLINPMFGVGMGYMGNNLILADFCIYWFHCTPLQVIASMGIIGVVAYAYYYFMRGKIMFNNLKRFNILLSFGIISFEIQSFLDAGTFLPFPYVFIIIVMTAALEHNNSVDKKTFLQSINI